MKKKLALGLTGVMMISALTSCGKSSSKYLLDENYSKYVKICEYKGLKAEKVKVEVTDEEVQERIDTDMYDFATYDPITDRGIAIGDYANIDYTSTLDGKESENYSGEGEDILVGEGYLYPELEDALIGMKTGESKQIEVELTKDYAEDEDVGKKMSVDFKINEITVENIPEYNEEFVKNNTDYDSISDYEASIKEELKESKEEEYKYEAIDNMMNYIVENSQFDGYPDELYKQCEENYDNSNAYTAAMYGMEVEDYLELMGIDDDTKKKDIEANVNNELVIGAIAQEEVIDCTEEEIDKFVKDVYADYGYESEKEFLEDYSQDEIGYEIIYEKVIELLYDNASFTEVSEEEYKEAHPEEEYLEEDLDSEESTDESKDAQDVDMDLVPFNTTSAETDEQNSEDENSQKSDTSEKE